MPVEIITRGSRENRLLPQTQSHGEHHQLGKVQVYHGIGHTGMSTADQATTIGLVTVHAGQTYPRSKGIARLNDHLVGYYVELVSSLISLVGSSFVLQEELLGREV